MGSPRLMRRRYLIDVMGPLLTQKAHRRAPHTEPLDQSPQRNVAVSISLRVCCSWDVLVRESCAGHLMSGAKLRDGSDKK